MYANLRYKREKFYALAELVWKRFMSHICHAELPPIGGYTAVPVQFFIDRKKGFMDWAACIPSKHLATLLYIIYRQINKIMYSIWISFIAASSVCILVLSLL